MENHLTYEERPKQQQAAAKAAILAQCDRLAAEGVTFVAVHFDGSGDDGATEEVRCYQSDVFAYEDCELITYDYSHLQDHYEALVTCDYTTYAGVQAKMV